LPAGKTENSPTVSADTCRGDKWHLDEVVITIAGKKHWLRRAVDQEGFVLDVLVHSRRDKKAAKRLLRKRLKKHGRALRVLITDKMRSYAAAKREIMPGVEHRQHEGLNNRAENSHQPTRRRERIMKRFKLPRQVLRFLSTHDQIANIFSRRPNRDTALKFHLARDQAFTTWTEITGGAMAAQSRVSMAVTQPMTPFAILSMTAGDMLDYSKSWRFEARTIDLAKEAHRAAAQYSGASIRSTFVGG
jgi:putative transposase